jgi:hypothetical protein
MSEDRMSSDENIRNSESSPDRGTSSDRAMMTDRGSESRSIDSERGVGSSGERNLGRSGSDRSSSSSDDDRSSSGGGISNRDLDREQSEQDQLPERGRSQSER